MKCPKCQEPDTKVIESRDAGGGESIRRRRKCLKCNYRYTTYERIEHPNMAIVKKDGTRQLFDRSKIMAGLDRACEKTSVSAVQKDEIASRVEKALYDMGEAEIESKCVGELVMKELAQIDEVAYVRFASVYRHFKDLKSFEKELATIKNNLQ